MKEPAKRQYKFQAHQETGIRYAVLGVLGAGAFTIQEGILLSLNEVASETFIFGGIAIPAFIIIVGALIVVSVLLQAIAVTYNTTGRQMPAQKIGRPFDDDVEITDNSE